MNDLLTRYTAEIILGITWVIAWKQVLYADELPGDGFTAGVFLLVAVLLEFVVIGRRRAAAAFPVRWFYASACTGIALLVVLFVLPLAWGEMPLQHFEVPLGVTHLSSSTLFDVGIFLAIAGALVVGLSRLEEKAS